MISKIISKNHVSDFISFAKTGKKNKLQKAIDMGIDISIEDSKAFILSARFGQLDTLKILLDNLKSVEKSSVIRHCFLESCNSNQRNVIDYLLESHYEHLNDETMKEIALKSCMIGNQNEVLLYLCAKYNFNLNLNKDILDWALKNDYKEGYTKLEVIFLNKNFKNKTGFLFKNVKTIKI